MVSQNISWRAIILFQMSHHGPIFMVQFAESLSRSAAHTCFLPAGPEGSYSVLAGRDASRSLAKMDKAELVVNCSDCLLSYSLTELVSRCSL